MASTNGVNDQEIQKMILADAIATAIKAERENEKLKIVIGVLTFVSCALFFCLMGG